MALISCWYVKEYMAASEWLILNGYGFMHAHTHVSVCSCICDDQVLLTHLPNYNIVAQVDFIVMDNII